MDIAAMSMQQSLQSVQTAVSMAVLKKAMNQDVQTMSALIGDMQTANVKPPSVDGLGMNFDIRA